VRQSPQILSQLTRPIARMRPNLDGADFLAGSWQVCTPKQEAFSIEIEGAGELVESWESWLGLEKAEFKGKQRFNEFRVRVPAASVPALSEDISGTYRLLPKCDAACASLHKRVQPASDGRPMYFFLDPSRCHGPKDDYFVFAQTHRRLAYSEQRCELARLSPAWRPTGENASFECAVDGMWTDASLTVDARAHECASVSKPPSGLQLTVDDTSCERAIGVIRCVVPLSTEEAQRWPEEVTQVDVVKERSLFDSFLWFTSRLELPSSLTDWASVAFGSSCGAHTRCERCAPSPPALTWVHNGTTLIAREDVQEAGRYEQALKARPAALQVWRNRHEATGEIVFGVNVASLVHQAASRLPCESDSRPTVSWRICIHEEDSTSVARLPALALRSNRSDPQSAQPPNFKSYPLRMEQLRSLHWMLEQETMTEDWHEEEVSEALLPALKWRVEARAHLSVPMRGGVLADQVGYGKTAITLGLIDSAPRTAPPQIPTAISVKATLVVVPPQLLKQWPSEIAKFTGTALKVLVLSTMGDLNRVTIKAIEDADIVVISATVFRSDLYFERLTALAAATTVLDKKGGRHFTTTYKATVDALGKQVERIRRGADGVREAAAHTEKAEAVRLWAKRKAVCMQPVFARACLLFAARCAMLRKTLRISTSVSMARRRLLRS
jgi:hypothetical protein